MRNILAHVNHRNKQRVVEKLKQIWYQPTKESALQYYAFASFTVLTGIG